MTVDQATQFVIASRSHNKSLTYILILGHGGFERVHKIVGKTKAYLGQDLRTIAECIKSSYEYYGATHNPETLSVTLVDHNSLVELEICESDQNIVYSSRGTKQWYEIMGKCPKP